MTIRAGGAVAELVFPGEVRLIGYGPGPSRRAKAGATLNKLRIRAIVLEDDAGERIALVSGDFWAASSWIHARLGGQLSESPALKLDRSRVFFSGTHTHCSAGGLFESKYYSVFAQAFPFDAGFDEALAWNIADQLAKVVIKACNALQPATLSVAEGDFSTESINRSYGAYAANNGENSDAQYPESLGRTAVTPELDLLVARALDGTVIGVWGAVNCHGTALGKNVEKLHPDFLGSAARLLEGDFAANAAPWVLCSGAIGDVDPQPSGKTREQFIALREDEAKAFFWMQKLAAALKDSAEQAVHENDGDPVSSIRFEARQIDALVPNAVLSGGRQMPAVPMIGDPVLRGSELGKGPFSYEGKRKVVWDNHPHWPKLASNPFTLVANSAMAEHEKHLSISLFKLGDLMWLVGIPGEPTTTFASNVRAALESSANGAAVLVCGVNGGYNGYFVTPAEYGAQHYEGASCIWGPNTEPFVLEHLAELAKPLPPPPPSASIAVSFTVNAPVTFGVAMGITAGAAPAPAPGDTLKLKSMSGAPPASAQKPAMPQSVQKALDEDFAWITCNSPHDDALLEIGTERIVPLIVQPMGKKKFSLSFLVHRHQLGAKGKLVRVMPSGNSFKLKESAPRARATAKAPAQK